MKYLTENFSVRSNIVRVYCNYIYMVILSYFTFIFDLELMREISRNKTPFLAKSAARGSYSGVSGVFENHFYCTST